MTKLVFQIAHISFPSFFFFLVGQVLSFPSFLLFLGFACIINFGFHLVIFLSNLFWVERKG